MAEFEYKTISIDNKETEHSQKALSDKLNHYGKDGWELAACFAHPCIGSSPYSLIGITQKAVTPRKGGDNMNFPIPDFVPVPSAEIMRAISTVSLIVGICLVGAGLLLLFLNRKKEKGKKATGLWVFIGVGALLIANHSIQLLF